MAGAVAAGATGLLVHSANASATEQRAARGARALTMVLVLALVQALVLVLVLVLALVLVQALVLVLVLVLGCNHACCASPFTPLTSA